MKFEIEKQTDYKNGEQKITYYLWVRDKDKIVGSLFSFHNTLEEAKDEIEKIKNIYPENRSEYLILPDMPDYIKIEKEAYLDRFDNYTLKYKYYLYVNDKYKECRATLEAITNSAKDYVEIFNNSFERKCEIVFSTEY